MRLYDFENDPHERNNLVDRADLSGIRAQLARTLKRRMAEAGEEGPVIRPRIAPARLLTRHRP